MNVNFFTEETSSMHYTPPPKRKRYGCFSFLFDGCMVVFTGGFWLIWIFCREMRKAR